jgi:exosortase
MEDWGHAYIIPLISGYMLWLKRDELAAAPRAPFWPGLAVVMCGIASYFFFLIGISNHLGQGLALILTIAGLVIFLLGPEIFRLSFVAIAYLIFAITLPEQVMNLVTFQLKLLASAGAGVMLTLLSPIWGYSITIEGNTIVLLYKATPIPLNVADACSGMRMVVAFFALGAAVAIFACKHWWQRVALLLMAAPVALFMNVIRVAVLGIASLYNPAFAQGDAHMLIGTLLLIPGLGLFLGVVWILNKLVLEPSAAVAAMKTADSGTPGRRTP